MKLKFSGGLLILFIVLLVQFWLASLGIALTLSFAALISFAFIFDIWELIVYIVIAVFIVNWQPGVSWEILIFGLYPIAVYFSRTIVRWQPWLLDIAAIFVGFLVLYLLVMHGAFHYKVFLMDIVAGAALGTLIFFVLS